MASVCDRPVLFSRWSGLGGSRTTGSWATGARRWSTTSTMFPTSMPTRSPSWWRPRRSPASDPTRWPRRATGVIGSVGPVGEPGGPRVSTTSPRATLRPDEEEAPRCARREHGRAHRVQRPEAGRAPGPAPGAPEWAPAGGRGVPRLPVGNGGRPDHARAGRPDRHRDGLGGARLRLPGVRRLRGPILAGWLARRHRRRRVVRGAGGAAPGGLAGRLRHGRRPVDMRGGARSPDQGRGGGRRARRFRRLGRPSPPPAGARPRDGRDHRSGVPTLVRHLGPGAEGGAGGGVRIAVRAAATLGDPWQRGRGRAAVRRPGAGRRPRLGRAADDQRRRSRAAPRPPRRCRPPRLARPPAPQPPPLGALAGQRAELIHTNLSERGGVPPARGLRRVIGGWGSPRRNSPLGGESRPAPGGNAPPG